MQANHFKISFQNFRVLISDEILAKLFEFTIFVVKVYVTYWTTSSSAIEAPVND